MFYKNKFGKLEQMFAILSLVTASLILGCARNRTSTPVQLSITLILVGKGSAQRLT